MLKYTTDIEDKSERLEQQAHLLKVFSKLQDYWMLLSYTTRLQFFKL